jgi:hypothetical protein
MSDIRHISDHVNSLVDTISGKPGLWAKTEIIAGYGYHHSNDRFALSYLDEPIFDPQQNTVPISGVQGIFEMLFGINGPITIETLYSSHGIGLPDESSVPSFLVPENDDIEAGATLRSSIFQTGHLCQLVGIGITGTAENNITVHKVGYRETDIEMTVKTADGNMDGIMLPFRYTESDLDPNERQLYFGKKLDAETGKTGYYLKRFESWPEIKHVWRSSDESAGTKVSEVAATNSTIWDQSRDDALKSVVEIHFTISEYDLKEYFQYKLDQSESARFNTIALYTGRYSELNKSGDEQFGDYCNVRLFSKLNIPTESVSLEKDLEFIYRIYGS